MMVPSAIANSKGVRSPRPAYRMAHSVNLLFSAGRRLSPPPLVRALVGEDFKIDPVS
jgi:hypothetical protein